MATPARDENGKFLKGVAGQPNGAGAIDTANAGTVANDDDGKIDGIVNPAELDGQRDTERAASGTEPGKRGRGRPPKQKQEQRKVENPARLDLDSLNFTLFYAHSLLAKATNTPELMLDETEAKSMAAAAMNVMQHYNIRASQKAVDWGNLVVTMCIVYGGKFHAINERQKAEKQAKKEAAGKVAAPFFGGA